LFSDFITVDGAEWNRCCTLFSDAVGMPIEPALIFVNKTLISLNIRDKIRVICSGKIISGYSILRAIATGADTQQRQRFYVFY
jgi:glutamate synthase domain-containing protein 2